MTSTGSVPASSCVILVASIGKSILDIARRSVAGPNRYGPRLRPRLSSITPCLLGGRQLIVARLRTQIVERRLQCPGRGGEPLVARHRDTSVVIAATTSSRLGVSPPVLGACGITTSHE